MKKILCILLVSIPFLVNAQSVKWVEGLSWNEIKEKAQKDNKYIFMDCYASWCVPCKQMDKEVYTSDSIGEALNDKFISVKVQFDKTDKDGVEIKKWYGDAESIQKQYPLKGFPSLLFFSPSGELIYKKTGFHNVSAFKQVVTEVQDPKRISLALSLEEYRRGKLDYSKFIDLANDVDEMLSDKVLLDSIAKDFKSNYYDMLPDTGMLNKRNFLFVMKHAKYISTSDKIFKMMLANPLKFDTIVNVSGHTARMVTEIINKEEIMDKLWSEGIPIKKEVNWASLQNSIQNKYGKSYVEELFPRAKVAYYFGLKDWKKCVPLVEKIIKDYSPKEDGSRFSTAMGSMLPSDSWALNEAAWIVFLRDDNKEDLKKALNWINRAMNICKDTGALVQYFDTKANILYKLFKLYNEGSIHDALTWEQNALRLTTEESPLRKEYLTNLEKIQSREKTWIE